MKVSDEQARYWREELDITGAGLLDLLDDREELLRREAAAYRVVNADKQRIEKLERDYEIADEYARWAKRRIEKLEKERDDWHANFGIAEVLLRERKTRAEQRIEKLERVVELARKSYTRQGYNTFREALSALDKEPTLPSPPPSP